MGEDHIEPVADGEPFVVLAAPMHDGGANRGDPIVAGIYGCRDGVNPRPSQASLPGDHRGV